MISKYNTGWTKLKSNHLFMDNDNFFLANCHNIKKLSNLDTNMSTYVGIYLY